MSYRPNRVAGAELIHSIWPLVRSRVPDARLVIAGKDAATHFAWADGLDGVELHSDPEDAEIILAAASLVVVPVRQGGGTQLKVIEALGLGRLPVVTGYSARSIPTAVRSLCPVAESNSAMAAAICQLVETVDERHRREQLVLDAGLPDWGAACRPLLEVVASRTNASEAA
jgi:glycosyltransferase involved in cell wall biosynthesis